MARRPSFQFYPGDWLNDQQLRMVSVGARGLWIDMLCIMHQAGEHDNYGRLMVGPKVILPNNLARLVGATLEETEGWLDELRQLEVFSEDAEVIFSRRMIRDEEIRRKRAAGGKKGGNPILLEIARGRKDNLPGNLPGDPKDNRDPTPSSSSSSSPSPSEEDGEGADAPPPRSDRSRLQPEILRLWHHYQDRSLPRFRAVLGKRANGHGKMAPPKPAEDAIIAAFRAGHDEAEIRRAMDNASHDAWLLGLLDRKKNPSPDLQTWLLIRRSGSKPLDRVEQLSMKDAPDNEVSGFYRQKLDRFDQQAATATEEPMLPLEGGLPGGEVPVEAYEEN